MKGHPMATSKANQDQQQKEGFFANATAAVKAVQQAVNAPIDKVTGPILQDGMIAAAFRQGAGELYEALKPFPQSLQVNEPGTLLNPTQGEIAAAREEKPPTLSEIAAGKPAAAPEPDNGKQQEQQNQKSMGMSM
jgi:hypothetical protein